MRMPRTASSVLVYQGIAFGALFALSAFNHALDLPQILAGGEAGASRWQSGILETGVIVLSWAFAFLVTRRLLLRLRYLEGMLRVCAWCRNIGYQDKWMSLEKYFAEGFQVGTTHGICPACLKKLEEDTSRFYRKEVEARQQAAAVGSA